MSEYHGFVFDIDGTAVPNGVHTVESIGLIEAFAALPADVIAIAATGRTPEFALPITRALSLKHESVVANGALIINSQTGEHVWERLLSEKQVAEIIKAAGSEQHQLWLTGDPKDEVKTVAQQLARPTAAAFLMSVHADEAHDIRERLLGIPDVNAYLSIAWGGGENMLDINIGHAEAHKRNALEVLFGMYAIDAALMMGVGDGINDFELFKAVGHRIAVANADPLLIEQADEVVASQQDDGLVQVIQKFL